MWKKTEIGNKIYFISCKIIEENAKCMFTNLEDYWGEAITTKALIQRAKELNKRIKYDESIVYQTLQQQDLERAELTTETRLKLKYRVKNYFFNFEWILHKLTNDELKETLVQPLLKTLHGVTKQIEELREIVRKKDAELAQYRLEGAILRRTTVATQPFNFAAFDEKFSDINALSKGFGEMAKMSVNMFEDVSVTENIKPKIEEPTTPPRRQDIISPRHRKRKAMDIQKRIREQRSRGHKLEFESSQTLSQELSQKVTEAQECVASTSDASLSAVPTAVIKEECADISTSADDVTKEFEDAVRSLNAFLDIV